MQKRFSATEDVSVIPLKLSATFTSLAAGRRLTTETNPTGGSPLGALHRHCSNGLASQKTMAAAGEPNAAGKKKEFKALQFTSNI